MKCRGSICIGGTVQSRGTSESSKSCRLEGSGESITSNCAIEYCSSYKIGKCAWVIDIHIRADAMSFNYNLTFTVFDFTDVRMKESEFSKSVVCKNVMI